MTYGQDSALAQGNSWYIVLYSTVSYRWHLPTLTSHVQDLKLGYLAKGQAGVVVENIKKLLYPTPGKAGPALKKYPPAPAATLVSMGRNHALIQTPLGAFSGWLPTQIKSKNMFIDKTREEFGIVEKK